MTKEMTLQEQKSTSDLMLLEKNINDDNYLRKAEMCIGCGQEKQIGCVVCWGCFKSGDNPFKWFNGTISEWVKTMRSI